MGDRKIRPASVTFVAALVVTFVAAILLGEHAAYGVCENEVPGDPTSPCKWEAPEVERITVAVQMDYPVCKTEVRVHGIELSQVYSHMERAAVVVGKIGGNPYVADGIGWGYGESGSRLENGRRVNLLEGEGYFAFGMYSFHVNASVQSAVSTLGLLNTEEHSVRRAAFWFEPERGEPYWVYSNDVWNDYSFVNLETQVRECHGMLKDEERQRAQRDVAEAARAAMDADRPPQIVRRIPPQTLYLGETGLIDLSSFFRASEEEPIVRYHFNLSNQEVASETLLRQSDGMLTLHGTRLGSTVVRVKACDATNCSDEYKMVFTLTVVARPTSTATASTRVDSPPQIVRRIPPQTLYLGETGLIDLSSFFRASEEEPIVRYHFNLSNQEVASETLLRQSDGMLTLQGTRLGSTVVRVKACDATNCSDEYKMVFTLTVVALPTTVPTATPAPTAAPGVSATPAPTPVRVSAVAPASVLLPSPTPMPKVERGFFTNSLPSPSGAEAALPFDIMDPVTLSLIGVLVTLGATAIQLFRGR